MSRPPTDYEILVAIGTKALVAAGYTEDAVKQWRSRGVIPWKERAKVADLASLNRVWVPADFIRERRAA
jgi:hypothetical protein